MTIHICSTCKGDGFWRVTRDKVDPMTNIAHAWKIYSDGYRVQATASPRIKPDATNPFDVDYPIAYEFTCQDCKGTGEINESPPVVEEDKSAVRGGLILALYATTLTVYAIWFSNFHGALEWAVFITAAIITPPLMSVDKLWKRWRAKEPHWGR